MQVSFDYTLLRGRMATRGVTIAKLSEATGINEHSLSAKLRNKTQFWGKEIKSVADALEIPADDIGKYFFSQ